MQTLAQPDGTRWNYDRHGIKIFIVQSGVIGASHILCHRRRFIIYFVSFCLSSFSSSVFFLLPPGRFDLQTLLLSLVTSLGLLELSSLVVDSIMKHVMPRRVLYNEAKYEETVDFAEFGSTDLTSDQTMAGGGSNLNLRLLPDKPRLSVLQPRGSRLAAPATLPV